MRLFAIFLAAAASAAGAGIPYLTEPTLCPTRPEIAFVSGGDIWVVSAKGGEAHLLVSNPAEESHPLYSPDGAGWRSSPRAPAAAIYTSLRWPAAS